MISFMAARKFYIIFRFNCALFVLEKDIFFDYKSLSLQEHPRPNNVWYVIADSYDFGFS